jgi:acyl dehydratase
MSDSTVAEQTIVKLQPLIGVPEPPSPWYAITQNAIDAFAALTHDHNYIHVDPERSAAESPYGTTIAHGFYSLSLLPHLASSIKPPLDGRFQNARTMVNYGLNKLRFVSPVKVGARIRAQRTLREARARGSEWVQLSYDVTMEVENESKPALVAEWLVLMICHPAE